MPLIKVLFETIFTVAQSPTQARAKASIKAVKTVIIFFKVEILFIITPPIHKAKP